MDKKTKCTTTHIGDLCKNCGKTFSELHTEVGLYSTGETQEFFNRLDAHPSNITGMSNTAIKKYIKSELIRIQNGKQKYITPLLEFVMNLIKN